MINGIGPKGTGRIDPSATQGVQRNASGGQVSAVDAVEAVGETAAAANPARDLAEQGAPIDYARIQQIRAAIANGAYALEVKAIAARMIALDLPPRG